MNFWGILKKAFGNKEEGGLKRGWVALVFLIPFVACVVYAYLLPQFISDPSSRGVYGDMFGAVNTLFSGLAFAGIIYTIYQQGTELRLQRKELKMQREEVAKTNKALEEQIKTAEIQRFENTFFNMIDLHNNLVKDLAVTVQDVDTWVQPKEFEKIYTGKEAFSYLYNEFKDTETRMKEIANQENIDAVQFYGFRPEAMGDSYDSFFKKTEKKIQPYYKNLFNLISIIHEKDQVEDEEKKYYLRILESQLSPDELLMLFYRTMTKGGRQMRILTKQYSLLKDIRGYDLIYTEDLEIYNNID